MADPKLFAAVDDESCCLFFSRLDAGELLLLLVPALPPLTMWLLTWG